MAFYVFTDDTHTTIVKASDVKTNAQKSKTYCCPGCSANFRFRSEASNGTPAHFYLFQDSHDDGCWVPYAGKGNNTMLSTPDRDFDPIAFLNTLIAHGSRSPMGKSGSHKGGGSKALRLSTVRNLYKFCLLHPDTETVNGSLRIKELFVGRKTSYLYTKHVSGIKLVEADFWYYDSTSIWLSYPFNSSRRTFKVRLNFEGNADLYFETRRRLFGATTPVLIYADWETVGDVVYTNVSTKTQVIVSTR